MRLPHMGQQGDASASSEMDICQAPLACRKTSGSLASNTRSVDALLQKRRRSSLKFSLNVLVQFCSVSGIALLTPLPSLRTIVSQEHPPPHLTSNAHV